MRDLSFEMRKIAADIEDPSIQEGMDWGGKRETMLADEREEQALADLESDKKDAMNNFIVAQDFLDDSKDKEASREVAEHWFKTQTLRAIEELDLVSLFTKDDLLDMCFELSTDLAVMTAIDSLIKQGSIDETKLSEKDLEDIKDLELTEEEVQSLGGLSWL